MPTLPTAGVGQADRGLAGCEDAVVFGVMGMLETVPLGAIADIQLGKMLSPKSKQGTGGLPYLRNQNVQWDAFDLTDVATMNFDEDERNKFLLRPGDLLVCEGGEPGRSAIWRGQIKDCYYQKALHRIRPRAGFESEYLLFALWHISNQGTFADLNSKTTIAHLPLVRLQAVRVPLIDRHRQVSVVKKLRCQLSCAREALEASSEQVSVANAKMTAALLVEFFGRSPSILVGKSTGERGFGWTWSRLSDLAHLYSGHTPSRRRSEWWGGKIPWLALPDIRKLHGRVAQQTVENTNDLGLANSSARLLPVGTVCVSRTASIGFVTKLGRPMATSQDFCNWVCDRDRLDPEFLMYAFMASQDYLREQGSGAVHKTIYMPAIESFHICAPDIAEQRRIARRLRERLAEAEALSAGVKARLAEIKLLPQRILAAAFEV